jgi:hypothetical protein
MPTIKSYAACNMGAIFQQLNHDVFKPAYPVLREEIQKSLQQIGIPIVMPSTIQEYEAKKKQILPSIGAYLKELRSQLWGRRAMSPDVRSRVHASRLDY